MSQSVHGIHRIFEVNCFLLDGSRLSGYGIHLILLCLYHLKCMYAPLDHRWTINGSPDHQTWHEVADQMLIFDRHLVSELHRIKTMYFLFPLFLPLTPIFLFSPLSLIAFSPSLSSTLSPQSLSLYSSHPPTIPFLTPRW